MMTGTGEMIPQLLQAAKALRDVRRMHRNFMLLWAIDAINQKALSTQLGESSDDPLADPKNRNWKLLYRGSILDD